MKVTYELRTDTWIQDGVAITYKICAGALCIGQVFRCDGSTAWRKAPDRGLTYRTRNDATRSLISSQLGVRLWCPNCQSPVEFETWLDGSKELYDVCSKCNEPVEEITP